MCRNLILLFVTVLIILIEINALTLDEQNAILACHNNFRASLANGKEQNKTGLLPSGMNIKKLTYSKTVEASATNWANKCTESHTPSNQRKYGENLAMDGDAKITTKDALLKACKNWWGEFKKVGIQSSLVVNGNNFINIGHATQMAWAETTEIGCGVAKCPNAPYKTYTVCQYNKPGNYLGQVVYKKGKACSGCGSKGCSNGLCNN
uniref:SCP domain-containing protein n=2 Tax=Meloidogyne enterolobii TaxID=390850 RepID=A0A6V7UYJ3_MELEN|nr:unnamed protein product [Meloidogyne enterolobii]